MSITDAGKNISEEKVVFNHDLYAVIANIHLAIATAIKEGEEDSLKKFFEETSYSLTSIIRINNKATVIFSHIISTNAELLRKLDFTRYDIDIMAELLLKDQTVFDDVSSVVKYKLSKGFSTGYSVIASIVLNDNYDLSMFNDGNVFGEAIIQEACPFYQETPLLHYLLKAHEGNVAQKLVSDAKLVEMISAESLNYLIPSGPKQGESALYWLAGHVARPAVIIKVSGIG
ncbi:hypothetical protein [Candidatus Synchoanobacter obligatus]|uniref:Uncharacterized protein n=1 Tax=Candidatus Synchoanobacter obligatus TaxID=2919597 RepID=A0ABT1L5F3_9GAMM|nr:hypothetical protein [Candidatus Synchoanobacter obligatus]MCP8351688.1 hypothetical protein [Candidatus Synchoanobacter obligatus]